MESIFPGRKILYLKIKKSICTDGQDTGSRTKVVAELDSLNLIKVVLQKILMDHFDLGKVRKSLESKKSSTINTYLPQ